MKKSALIIAVTLTLNGIFSLFLFQHLKSSLAEEPAGQTNSYAQTVSFRDNQVNTKPGLNGIPENFVATAGVVTPAVVNIAVRGRSDFGAESGGSGVIISTDGYIITNNHVVDGGGKVTVTLQNKRTYEASVVGKDPMTDLALLKIEGNSFPTLRYADSDEIQVGEWVLAIGNPFNLTSTVTAGIISAKGRNINILQGIYAIESFIQTDAVVNPGNSGGALVNLEGELVGINSAIMSETGSYEGYSFAIPSNLVKKIIRDLKEHGTVQRAILGVSIIDVNDEIAADMDLPQVEGVLVRGVTDGSSADVADLRMNDIIVAINGSKTTSVPELQEQVARFRPGDSVSLDIIRSGRKMKKDNVLLKSYDPDKN